MLLTSGAQLGSYVVESLIGSGGMGEVYRARDTRLNRQVALKVVPEAFVLDADRLARFKREAQTLAALNHTNIAAIYGLENWDAGVAHPHAPLQALVLELVDGPTLADRISQGPIALDEALRIARQICDALEAAHDRGIVHRDLKPANIKLTPDRTVKVLDFGLAKLGAPDASAVAPDASQSPTITSPVLLTGAGMILGTAAYMSPEQAQGKAAGRRGDIWAFGCVLYEMLTGTRAFAGDNVAETIANVLKSEPDWGVLPGNTARSVRRLLRRCLEKDPRRRLSDIADARLEIDDAISGVPGDEAPSPAVQGRSRRAWAVGAAVLSIVGVVTLVWTALRPPPTGASEMRLEIVTPPNADPQSLAISPDGRQIVFAAASEGRTLLWLRSIDGVVPRPVERTDGAAMPFWSPDSQSVAFFADGQLKRIDLDTGTVRTLAEARLASGGSWNRDGVILFAPSTGPIFRISAAGGTPEATTRLSSVAGGGHRMPEFLPDHRHFLFHTREPGRAGEIWVGDLADGEARRLVEVDRSDTGAAYAPSGHLLFIRDATLFAQPFDAADLQLTGEPAVVAEGVVAVKSGLAPGSPIIYRTGRSGPLQRQLVWFDRSGKAIARLGDPYRANSGVPAISPDGRQVVLSRAVDTGSASDLWLLDTTRGLFTRFTNDQFINNFPVWSPDGTRIVFQTNLKGVLDLYQKSISGNEPGELLLASPQNKSPSDWSPDGRWLLYRSIDAVTGWDLWALPLEGTRTPFPVVQTSFSELDGQFSPDGKWLAYQSNESGRDEIYLQPFPGGGRKVRVSTTGGTSVRWRADGHELFYLTLDEELMAVSVQFSQDDTPVPGDPAALFKVRVGGAIQGIYSATELSRQQYIVSRDGQRFLVNTVVEDAPAAPITVLLNWMGGA